MTDTNTSGAAFVRPDPSDCIHHFPAMFDQRKCIRCGWDFRNGSPPEKEEDRHDVAPNAANTSGADVLEAMDRDSDDADRFRLGHSIPALSGRDRWRACRDSSKAYAAVAALIEREAAQAKRIAELEQIAAGHRDGRLAALEKAAALESERDALAAEVKALRNRVAILEDAGAIAAGILEGAGAHCFALSDALASASAATGDV